MVQVIGKQRVNSTIVWAWMVLVIASVALFAWGAEDVYAQKRELKVGLLAPLTGNAASSGQDMVIGWNLWWEEHGNVVEGVKINIEVYDTASDPNTALTRARRAVEQDEVDVIVGPYLANEGLAVAPFLVQNRVPMLLPTVSADDLTQRQASPYIIRTAGWSSSQTSHPAGEWAYEQGYRTAVTLAAAYAFGYEATGGFVKTFTGKGGKILRQLWTPQGTADYGPYISQIRALNPDVVWVTLVGADCGRFLEQWKAFGMKDRIPLVTNEVLTDQSNIREIDPDAVVGIVSFAHYAEGYDSPANRAFVEKFHAKTGNLPSYMAAAFYTTGQWLTEAIRSLGGDISDQNRLLNAIRQVKMEDSPLGPLELDEYNNPIQDVYIRRAVLREDGRAWGIVEKIYPRVSQFWTFDPQEFLKQPVYSERYQGMAE